MNQFFQDILTTLSQHDLAMPIIMLAYLALTLLTIILAIICHLHFAGTLWALKNEARKHPITEKSAIPTIKNPFTRKIVADYILIAERSPTHIDTTAIATLAADKKSLLGWRYTNIIPFTQSMATGLILVSLLLGLALEPGYMLLGIITFLLSRILGAFFNPATARSHLISESALYLQREIARFYATDPTSAITQLENSFSKNLATSFQETMENIGHIMATSINTMSTNMTASIAPAMEKWQEAIAQATSTQTAIAQAATSLQDATAVLASKLGDHNQSIHNQSTALIEASALVKTSQEALTTQAKYIERNQHTLESSLHAYEESLQNITGAIGDALGTFINLHATTSAQVIADALANNIPKTGGDTPA